jgi:DNA-binding transcriptional MerR regulator
MSQQDGPKTTEQASYPFSQAAVALQTEPHLLWRYSQRFALFLGSDVAGEHPHYSENDLETLRTVLRLQDEGRSDAQIAQQLALRQADAERAAREQASAFTAATSQKRNITEDRADDLAETIDLAMDVNGAYAPIAMPDQETLPQALRDVFSALADGQQAVLNNQASMREIIGVVVQDNFNLKGENRKLRERMLDMERTLAEYQRREETRKERLEGRLRALEGTVGGLQQQIAQIVQVLRKRRRGWFW